MSAPRFLFMRLPRFLCLLLLSASAALADNYDVIVYGATPGGISAALAASREGASVLIVEPTRWIGGMVTGGLASTDVGNEKVIGGIAREFFTRAAASKAGTPMWYAEPQVNMATFKALLQETKVQVITERNLKSISRDGDRIDSLVTSDGKRHEAKVFIDATYEGDLMARAGVKYHVGREANAEYGETLNGVQVHKTHQFELPVDPYVVEGDPKSGLLPGVQTGDADPPGTGDRRIQAYNFRLCLTEDPDNRIPFERPAGYDPKEYVLLGRYLAKG